MLFHVYMCDVYINICLLLLYDVPVGFVIPLILRLCIALFAVARYRMICLVLVKCNTNLSSIIRIIID